MNNFFGNVTAPVDGNYDSAISNIPDGTVVPAYIEESKWESFTNPDTGIEATFIKNTWTIQSGEFQNRKVFQKMHVMDEASGKRENALKMLAAIDANCGGKVFGSGVQPDDMMLAASLCNVPMNISVAEWHMNGKSGNYVSAVGRLQAPQVQQPVMSTNQAINQAVQNVQQQPQVQPQMQQQPQMQPVQQPQMQQQQ